LEYKKQFYDFLKQSYTIHTDTFICINDNVETSICFSPQRVDKYVYDLLDYIEQHNKQMVTIYKILYLMLHKINNRFLEYEKQFYEQSYTKHTDAFICINDNIETSICSSSQRVDKYVYGLLDYIEQHNKQMTTICKISYLMLHEINNRFLEYEKQFYEQSYTIHTDTFVCINDNVETSICFSSQIYKSECLTGGSCRILLDTIGFYDHVYTNLIRSPYCDNAISAVKDLLVGIAILPETIQPTITRDQYLQSLEALLTNTPSGVTITFGNVSNQLIEFLATLFATNPRAYIYYTTSFDIEDNRLTTFANELSNNLSTYLDENHPLYRDLLVVLLSTNLA
jgi:predicted Zn-dependent protease with MMP-like domain